MEAFFIIILLTAAYGIAKGLIATAMDQIPGVSEPRTYISNGRRYTK